MNEDSLPSYSLTTAEIIYSIPDHPHLLQTYVWQEFDRPPEFPRLRRFLDFWDKTLDGKLHSVRVMASDKYYTTEIRHFPNDYSFNKE